MIPVLVARGTLLAPTWRPSAGATSRRTRTTPTRRTWIGCPSSSSARSTCAGHAGGQDWGGLIGLRLLGRPERFAGSDRQYRPPDGRRPHERRLLAGSSSRRSRPRSPSAHHRRRVHEHAGRRGWSPRMTRPSPTTPSRRAARSSRPWCRPRPMTRPTTTTRLRGRCCARSRSLSSARSATRTHHQRGDAVFRHEVPARPPAHTTIVGGATSSKRTGPELAGSLRTSSLQQLNSGGVRPRTRSWPRAGGCGSAMSTGTAPRPRRTRDRHG